MGKNDGKPTKIPLKLFVTTVPMKATAAAKQPSVPKKKKENKASTVKKPNKLKKKDTHIVKKSGINKKIDKNSASITIHINK